MGGVCLVALICLGAPGGAAATAPQAVAAKGCGVNTSPGAYGPTYTHALRAKGTSCRSGRRVIKGWNNCRGGGKGRCGKTFGYRCKERRANVIRTQFDSLVTCKKRGKKVSFRITQFT